MDKHVIAVFVVLTVIFGAVCGALLAKNDILTEDIRLLESRQLEDEKIRREMAETLSTIQKKFQEDMVRLELRHKKEIKVLQKDSEENIVGITKMTAVQLENIINKVYDFKKE